MEEIIERALNVIKTKPEWVTFVKEFNDPTGFMLFDSPLIYEIKDAINAENPIHSGSSIALCLRSCQTALNQVSEPVKHYRVFH